MKTWILSIGSIIILTSIISILFPEGKLGKNIKSVFSLIVVLTIIQPLATIKNLDFSTILQSDEQQVVLQQDFIYYVTEQKITNRGIKYIEDTVIKTDIKNLVLKL